MPIFRSRKADDQFAEARDLADELAVLFDVLAQYPEGALLTFGAPCRCPDCGDFGFAERVDRHQGTAHNHCHTCGRDWTITLRALRTYRNDPSLRVRPLARPAAPAPAALWSTPSPAPRPTAEAPEPVEPAEIATGPVIDLDRADPGHAVGRPVEDTDATHPGAFVVLVVDDNPFDVALVEELLTRAADEVTVLHAPTRVDGLALQAAHHVDVVLLTLDLPDSTGLATMVDWQLHPGPKAPIVAVVDGHEPDVIRGAKAAGARQVIQKRHLSQLADDPEPGCRRLVTLLRRSAEALVSPG